MWPALELAVQGFIFHPGGFFLSVVPGGVPRVAAVHDMSGVGRCSLTVIMPVMSVMGVQVCPVPTAILSAHSGGFGKFAFQDLTGMLPEYLAHWKSLGLEFDALYSGFLGSSEQIDIVLGFIDDFGNGDCLVAVDPVMADNGKLYKTYTPDMQEGMKRLVGKAHLIMPNLTEACFLLDKPYSDEPLDEADTRAFLAALSGMGPEMVVLKSVRTSSGGFANAGYRRSDDSFWQVTYDRIPVSYPGTGDVFGGALIGALLSGHDFPEAIALATRFVSAAVEATYRSGTPAREGVVLEKVLGSLLSDDSGSTCRMIPRG
jgi:pyridoxine kinase